MFLLIQVSPIVVLGGLSACKSYLHNLDMSSLVVIRCYKYVLLLCEVLFIFV